jgi:hypothetical protein
LAVHPSQGTDFYSSENEETVMKLAKILCDLALLGLLSAAPAFAQKKLAPSEAKDHIGETATVRGNLGPASTFVVTALIWQ